MSSLLKSIGAILAGFAVVVILSTVTDAIFHALGVIPDGPLYDTLPLGLALFYRTIYTILGCYFTARLAPHHPMRHAMIIGCIGLVVGSAGAIVLADLGAPWYAWSVALESIPCAWIAGYMAEMRSKKPV